MTYAPSILLLVLWSAWLIQALVSAIQARKFTRLYDHKTQGRFDPYLAPAAVIVPFKGLDPCMGEHLRGLFEQQYADYELLLVVDSVRDPAYAALQRELEKYPHRKAQVLVAGPAGATEGQKVRNQLYAIDHLLGRAGTRPDPWVWVFADSDAVPGPRWLADLAGPLCEIGKTGVTTGYRWLVPQPRGGGTGASVWSHLASIMNSSVACGFGRDAFNHAWGGSMAVRADVAERGGLRDKLVGALCDDYQFTRMSRELGERVYFVPWCVVATPVDFDLRGLINFAHRQYLLTRVYAPKLFAAAAALMTLYVAGLVSAWVCLIAGLTSDAGGGAWGWGWGWPVGVLVTAFVLNQMRATFRRAAVARALGTEAMDGLRTTLRLDRWATPVWMTLHWLLIVRSAFGRTMNWRGIRYRLFDPQRVKRLDPSPAKCG